MNRSPGDQLVPVSTESRPDWSGLAANPSVPFTPRMTTPIRYLDGDVEHGAIVDEDPGAVVLTCANCGAAMDERKCKLICRCGYFLSCSDYY